jgi:hypothetical protein
MSMPDGNGDNVDAEGLYDDLAGASAAPKVASAKSPLGLMKTPSLSDDTIRLREAMNALEQENAMLKRNMGTLYRTATNEIRRKNNEITRLMAELDAKK